MLTHTEFTELSALGQAGGDSGVWGPHVPCGRGSPLTAAGWTWGLVLPDLLFFQEELKIWGNPSSFKCWQ